jgi:hypothetical protein
MNLKEIIKNKNQEIQNLKIELSNYQKRVSDPGSTILPNALLRA